MMEKMMARSVRLLFAAAGMGAAAVPALAQDAPMQRVEITGSSIKRATAETASPVTVINSDELLRSGKATVAEYLQTLTVDGAGSLPTSFGSGFAAGSTAISLRGLGATSTLVLLNGRRMAPYARADDGQKSFTDLSTVPMQIVERIEILKDGASSLYGADAIAGVVNIILRKDFTGLQVRAETGWSRYDDAKQNKASITYGQGDLDEDKYNWVVNAEYSQSDELAASARKNRDWIGHGDIRPWGYGLGTQYAGGYISNGAASPSPTGALLNPATGQYVSLPGCANFSKSVQNDPRGGCVWHQDQFRSLQPEIESINLYTRGTWQINPNLQAYTELGYSERRSSFTMTPGSTSSTVIFPGQNNVPQMINYGSLINMDASHPQNPYGQDVRLRYSMFDVGPSVRNAKNTFNRFVVGLKGTNAGWDWETGFTHSESKLDLNWTNMINMQVLNDALSNPNSALFPYYIGDQAGKNSPALYAALTRNGVSHSTTKLNIVDFKASRELPIALPGGNIGLAIGGEHRQEKLDNPSFAGSENGSINSSYTAAFGDTKVSAVYIEALAPILKSVELTGALRYDHYDKFNSTTPKLGLKWTPVKTFALRGTYTEGFRAPSAAENNPLSQATGSASVQDPVRCPTAANGVPTPIAGASQTDCSISISSIKIGNPNLKPEESKGYTLGMVWDPFDGTSLSVDGFKIKRENEINPVSYAEAATQPGAVRNDNNLKNAAGQIIPGTGTLLVVQGAYRNSSFTEVSGVDVDIKQRLRLGAYGKATIGLTWTHIASFLRAESDTLRYQFAGTHGNCDTSNCMGTPKNKLNLTASWDIGAWNFSGTANWRDSMKNIRYEGAPCASQFADGSVAPNGCKLASFTTVDLSTRWNVSKQLTMFASVANVFDKVAPLDPLTYGGMSFNPLDNSGAVGRYFKFGAQYKFF